jgi:hypothetical protein
MRKLKKEDTRTHAHTLAKEKNKSFAGTLSFGSHKWRIFAAHALVLFSFLFHNSSQNKLITRPYIADAHTHREGTNYLIL